MSPEKQRIAIAEAVGGWEDIRHDDAWSRKRGCFAPDYPNDLNAMHEAENNLSVEQLPVYFITLGRVVPLDGGLICATAAQRAEAFLRAIGKWEDAA